eukprot:s406_g6.t1
MNSVTILASALILHLLHMYMFVAVLQHLSCQLAAHWELKVLQCLKHYKLHQRQAMQKRVAKWFADEDAEIPTASKAKKTPPERLANNWRRMVLLTLRVYMDIMFQTVVDYLTSRNNGTIANLPPAKKDKSQPAPKNAAKVRRGIGQPLPRSKACKEWPCEPLECAQDEDK